MALVNCPECKKQVSEYASFCPNCGFGIKEHFNAIKERQASLEKFRKNHREFSPNDTGWYKLFTIYEFMAKRVAKTATQLLEFKTVRFDDFVDDRMLSDAMDFCNAFYQCIENTYKDIYDEILIEFRDFPDSQIIENLKEFEKSRPWRVMFDSKIFLRWHDFLRNPFLNNSAVVLQEADNRYAAEVVKKSSMGFGLITNSFTSLTLYAISSSIKEVEAENSANINRKKYVDMAKTNLERKVSVAWSSHFNEFLQDVELCHKLVFFEMGNILFKGYLFNWQMVDKEFIKPERKKLFVLEKAKRSLENLRSKEEKYDALLAKRTQYIGKKEQSITELNTEIDSISSNIKKMGIALFGDKARKKKTLELEIEDKKRKLETEKIILSATKSTEKILNEHIMYVLEVDEGHKHINWDFRHVYSAIFDGEDEKYKLYDRNGAYMYTFDSSITLRFGGYREFDVCKENGISYGNDRYESYVILSERY